MMFRVVWKLGNDIKCGVVMFGIQESKLKDGPPGTPQADAWTTTTNCVVRSSVSMTVNSSRQLGGQIPMQLDNI
eukprot:2761839-Amphidinium_carterae.2